MSDRRAKYIILASIIFVGIVGVSQGQGLFELNDANSSTPATSYGYLGHVTATLRDSDGNIKAYEQGDNTVVDSGRNCASDILFATGLGSECMMVKFIAIGSSDATIMFDQTNLVAKTTNGNIPLLTADINVGLNTVAFGGSAAVLVYDKAITILAADSGEGIGETGLFDSANEGTANMFARHTFPSIAVTTDDELTIRWTITTVGVT